MNELKEISHASLFDASLGAYVEITTFHDDLSRLGIAIQFPRAEVCRSRSAFAAAVEAAADFIWDQTYHALFGQEAVQAIPINLIELAADRSFVASAADARPLASAVPRGTPRVPSVRKRRRGNRYDPLYRAPSFAHARLKKERDRDE